MSSIDQGFVAYGAKLFTPAQPYDPFTKKGGPDDDAHYTRRPGIDFMRPWLAIDNDIAFQWPLGVEGFTLTTDPVLGSHSFIGDNKVVLDVINTGTEQITLAGSFPGDSAPSLLQALREVVRRAAPKGKILFIPELMSHAQRVQVGHAEWSRDQQGRGRTLNYSIDVQIIGIAGDTGSPPYTVQDVPTTAANKGNPARFAKSDSTHNTLQKIALWKLHASSKWDQLYKLNEPWFIAHGIPKSQAPSYRLPLGTTVYF